MTVITNIVGTTERPRMRFQSLIASFLRANTATPYNDNDVISDSAAAAKCIAFDNVGPSGMIRSGEVIMEPGLASTGFDLYLFDSEPTNHLDNAPLAAAVIDMPNLIGMLAFASANQRTWSVAGHSWMATAMNPLPYTAATVAGLTRIYGLLVVRGTPTPSALALVTVRLGVERMAPIE